MCVLKLSFKVSLIIVNEEDQCSIGHLWASVIVMLCSPVCMCHCHLRAGIEFTFLYILVNKKECFGYFGPNPQTLSPFQSKQNMIFLPEDPSKDQSSGISANV